MTRGTRFTFFKAQESCHHKIFWLGARRATNFFRKKIRCFFLSAHANCRNLRHACMSLRFTCAGACVRAFVHVRMQCMSLCGHCRLCLHKSFHAFAGAEACPGPPQAQIPAPRSAETALKLADLIPAPKSGLKSATSAKKPATNSASGSSATRSPRHELPHLLLIFRFLPWLA